MDGAQASAIHQALVSVQDAVTQMTFSSCDKDDVLELIERVENELHSPHPNLALMCTFLNSIARSLRAQKLWRTPTVNTVWLWPGAPSP